jgi:AraC family transcriptional regulator of adaptative response/methylated-DNA-[protein]-cysteine methyltransferase
MTITRPTSVTPAAVIPDAEACWDIVLARDTSFDGVFVVAVRTTGVYCRPSCPGRPKRENVTFLTGPEEAEQAGYRACKRCHPRQTGPYDEAPRLVAEACERIEDEDGAIPLAELAAMIETTPSALNAAFRRILGLSVQQYVEGQRVQRLKEGLREGHPVTRAMYEAGYSSPSRLYESSDRRLGMSPGDYRRGAPGAVIEYATAACPEGRILVAATAKGVCSVRFGDTDDEALAGLKAEFPRASIAPSAGVGDEGRIRHWLVQITDHLQGLRTRLDIPLDIQGTAFQWRVWRALQGIAYGQTKSYKQVAETIGRPTAARAVARACATNPVAVVIPCHRVVGSDGSLTGYAYGVHRKATILETEAGHRGEAAGGA